jgi:PIN domain nuclease of toxin-antitoxin system
LRLLLDTHALLWWFTDDPKLSEVARESIANEANVILVSAASAWEIATKYRLGKLPIGGEVLRRFQELVAADGFIHLPMNYLQSIRAGGYSMDHRDPFDRMLAAQAELEGVPLLTVDPAFEAFPVNVLW